MKDTAEIAYRSLGSVFKICCMPLEFETVFQDYFETRWCRSDAEMLNAFMTNHPLFKKSIIIHHHIDSELLINAKLSNQKSYRILISIPTNENGLVTSHFACQQGVPIFYNVLRCVCVEKV